MKKENNSLKLRRKKNVKGKSFNGMIAMYFNVFSQSLNTVKKI